MIRLLAVSDHDCHYLEQHLKNTLPAQLGLDYLLSCGDLRINYLDQLSSLSNLPLYYVNGNHDFIKPNDPNQFGLDCHARLIETDDFLICGFAGAKWYKPDDYQFKEHHMKRLTQQIMFKLKWRNLVNQLLNRPSKKPLIVISHAPPYSIHDEQGRSHLGFKCFLDFMRLTQPLLWLHGHVHLQSFNQLQQSTYCDTTIVNVYEFKLITINDNQVSISYKF